MFEAAGSRRSGGGRGRRGAQGGQAVDDALQRPRVDEHVARPAAGMLGVGKRPSIVAGWPAGSRWRRSSNTEKPRVVPRRCVSEASNCERRTSSPPP